MQEVKFWFVLIGGVLILAGSWVVIHDVACLKQVNLPPAPGIDVFVVILVITPLSVLSVLISLLGKASYSVIKQKLFYGALGAHLFYLYFIFQIVSNEDSEAAYLISKCDEWVACWLKIR